MSAKREPKTIEEARELLLAALPEGWRMYLSGHWHDSTDPTYRSIQISYRAAMSRNGPGSHEVTAEAGTPAALVKATLKALYSYIERNCPELLPAAPLRRQPARAARGNGQLKLTYKKRA